MTFFLCRGEKQSGPHSFAELRTLASGQQISHSDLLWCDAWDGWRPASEVPGVLTPELPAKVSEPEVQANGPSAKRLDNSWEARIRERGQLLETTPVSHKAQLRNARPVSRTPSVEIIEHRPLAPPIAEAPKRQHRVLNLFMPSGRVGRIRWMARNLIYLGTLALICAIYLPIAARAKQTDDLVLTGIGVAFAITAIAWFFAGLYLSLMNALKRIHDFNFSGWWFIPLILVTFVLGIGFLLLLLIPGTAGENRFGPPEGKGLLD